MKKSSEWIRQDHVTKSVDAILEANGGDLDQIKGYQVAAQLDAEPNGSIYQKFRDDMKRRRGIIAVPVEPVPVELMVGIKAALDQANSQLIATVTEQYAAHIARMSQNAAQRAALESKLYDQEKRAFDELLEASEQAAQERDLALAKLASIEKECARLTAKNLKLQGKADALSALIGAQQTPRATALDRNDEIVRDVSADEDKTATDGEDDYDRPNDIFNLMGVDGPPIPTEGQASEEADEAEG